MGLKKTGQVGMSEEEAKLTDGMAERDAQLYDIRLEIGQGANRQMVRLPDLQVGAQFIIGRHDDAKAIDLSRYSAFDMGVSRRHALLTVAQGEIYIEDNDSTNGTRINGYALQPQKPYRLRNRDEVEFGRLRVIIHLTPRR